RGSIDPEPEVLRDLSASELVLLETLLHHGHAHAHTLGDVAVGVVLVGRGPELTARETWAAPRRDAAVGDRIAQIAVLLAVGLVSRAAIDFHELGLELIHRPERRGEVLVGEHEDGHLVALGPVECHRRQAEALLLVYGSSGDVAEGAVGRMHR